MSVAEIGDGPLRSAMEVIGGLWLERPDGVLIEHRATDICLQAIAQLRLVLQVPDGAAVAVGGAPSGDPYVLPSLLAAAVLASQGIRAVNLGPDTPLDTLRQAVQCHAPLLVWLSVSVASEAGPFAQEVEQFAAELREGQRHLVVGGRGHASLGIRALPNLLVAGSMAELAALGQGLAQ